MNTRYPWLVKLAGGVLLLMLLVCSFGSWGTKADAQSTATKMGREMLTGFRFQVVVQGKLTGVFDACTGIGSGNEVVEHQSTDPKGRSLIQKIPGRLRWHDVVLTRGLSSDMGLWTWRQEVADGKIAEARKNCTITMMSLDGRPVAVWELTNVWPSDLVADVKDGGRGMTEEVTLSCEGMVRKQ